MSSNNNKVGFLLESLASSQLAFFAASQTAERPPPGMEEVILFYEEMALPCVMPHCPCMQAVDSFGYPGALVATSLSTARKAARAVSPRLALFYVWDLEWQRGRSPLPWGELHRAYTCLPLVARSHEHKKCLEDSWPGCEVVGVVRDCNFGEWANLLVSHGA